MPWRFERRADHCAVCGDAFRPGDRILTTLYSVPLAADEAGESDGEDATTVLLRRDVLADRADAEDAAPPPGPEFSRWTWEFPEPEAKRPVLDLAAAREFLVRLVREDAPERASLRYLLVLLLMRKRLVRLHEQLSDERGDVLVIEIPPDVPPTEIVCPELTEAESDTLRDELGRLFDLG